MLAAYIRLYPMEVTNKITIWHGCLFFFLICIATVGVYYVGYFNPYLKNNAVYLFGEMNKIPAIICAVLIFFASKIGMQNIIDLSIGLQHVLLGCIFFMIIRISESYFGLKC